MESLQLSSSTARSLANTKIAFSSNRSGHRSHREIYVMNPDGTGQTRLTHNPESSWQPAWSPDGTKLAYTFRDSHPQLYVMNADGSNPTPLTHDTASHGAPAWSPDGMKLAWHAKYSGRQPGAIYVMNADGTNPTRLTPQTPANNSNPAWSPDGTKLAFVSDWDGNPEIYVMDADGTNPTRLTSTTARNGNPAWSPDGTKLAFVSDRDGNREIYVMDADGTNPTRLTSTTARNENPVWSPDGTKLVFRSKRDGNWELYVMNADGTDQTRLTFNTADEANPAWSPFLPAVIPDTVHIPDRFARPGGHALVAVRVQANQPLAGAQFTIQPTIGGLPTTRVVFNGLINNLAPDGLTATFATDAEGVTTVLLFSTSGNTIAPGWQTLFHLVYDLAPELLAGTVIQWNVTNVILSSLTQEALPHELHTGTIAVGRPGDLVGGPLGVGDGRIDTEDVLAAVDIILGKRPPPHYGTLEFFLTDVNADDNLDLLDVIEIVNLSMVGALKRLTEHPQAPVLIGFGPVKRLESGQPVLTVMLDSDSVLAGLQMTITYTATQIQLGIPQAVGQAAKMTVASHITEEPATGPAPLGTLKIVLYSPTGQVIAPGRETILLIPATILREPSPDDTVDLLDLTVAVTCQVQMARVRLFGAAWVTVSARPFQTALFPNRLNPFKPPTQILYELAATERVTVAVYDLQGQEIVRLVDERQPPGRYALRWYGRDTQGNRVPAGDYLCRMTTSSGFEQTHQMTVLG